jgi:hypothetical protein
MPVFSDARYELAALPVLAASVPAVRSAASAERKFAAQR